MAQGPLALNRRLPCFIPKEEGASSVFSTKHRKESPCGFKATPSRFMLFARLDRQQPRSKRNEPCKKHVQQAVVELHQTTSEHCGPGVTGICCCIFPYPRVDDVILRCLTVCECLTQLTWMRQSFAAESWHRDFRSCRGCDAVCTFVQVEKTSSHLPVVSYTLCSVSCSDRTVVQSLSFVTAASQQSGIGVIKKASLASSSSKKETTEPPFSSQRCKVYGFRANEQNKTHEELASSPPSIAVWTRSPLCCFR